MLVIEQEIVEVDIRNNCRTMEEHCRSDSLAVALDQL